MKNKYASKAPRNDARKRTDIILLVTLALYLISLFAFGKPEKFLNINVFITGIFVTIIYVDYTALQHLLNYRKYLIFSIFQFLYAFLLKEKFGYYGQQFSQFSILFFCSPFCLLAVQWPLRKLYITLFNREPEVIETRSVSNFLYILLLFALPMLLLLFLSNLGM